MANRFANLTINDISISAASLKLTGPSNIGMGGNFKVIARGMDDEEANNAVNLLAQVIEASASGTFVVQYTEAADEEQSYDMDVLFDSTATFKAISSEDGDNLFVLAGEISDVLRRPRS